MRPIDKGIAPRTYTNYQDAQQDLVDRIGDYCSYCERQIETNLAVEHIQPKSKMPALRNEWNNFLLGCVNCNSSKGSENILVDDYFWPDTENTLLVFEYLVGGRIVPYPGLSVINFSKAQATISLFGLDRDPGHLDKSKHPSSKDKRWRRRQEAWDLAQRDLARLQQNNTIQVRELIVENALGRGMFSIWMKVFENDVDMRRRLINAFKGTAISCFDPNCIAINRIGGKL
ncbi:MAG: HNH endonuclease [Caldilinea sp. CFX5]|nr:HNH endonuclease [Caldilinea sp. CFX5]